MSENEKEKEKQSEVCHPVMPAMPPVPGVFGSPMAGGNVLNEMDDVTATNSMSDEEVMEIRQRSAYSDYNKATPDNNIFFEKRSNPLSSKGN